MGNETMAKISSGWKYQVVFEETIGMLLIVKCPVGSKQVGSIHFSNPGARIKEDTKSSNQLGPKKAEELNVLLSVMKRVSVNAVSYTRHPDGVLQTTLQLCSLLPRPAMEVTRLTRISCLQGKIKLLPDITPGQEKLTVLIVAQY